MQFFQSLEPNIIWSGHWSMDVTFFVQFVIVIIAKGYSWQPLGASTLKCTVSSTWWMKWYAQKVIIGNFQRLSKSQKFLKISNSLLNSSCLYSCLSFDFRPFPLVSKGVDILYQLQYQSMEHWIATATINPGCMLIWHIHWNTMLGFQQRICPFIHRAICFHVGIRGVKEALKQSHLLTSIGCRVRTSFIKMVPFGYFVIPVIVLEWHDASADVVV